MDTLTPQQRSAVMSRIRCVDTLPEMAVRRIAHALGYRYRLHSAKLPGKPDLVFASRKKVVFVHGCFWHLHAACREGRMPSSNRDYWVPKLERNRTRDAAHRRALRRLGWSSLVLWECELSNPERIARKLCAFLG